MNKIKEDYKCLPSVNKLLQEKEILSLIKNHSKDVVVFAIRNSLEYFRTQISKGFPAPTKPQIHSKINKIISLCKNKSLRKVYNATGVIIHTNLGRVPFGEAILQESFNVLTGYNNLEFDLEKGQRGNRNAHATELLKYLTGAEDVLIVNNNAAAIMLVLRAFAKKKEVIVSRGELIEIGGSFRIPEIMAASDCTMVEVGTTNKTNLNDYKIAITKKTAVLFKAHKSNYVIKGFTEDVDIEKLSLLGKQNNIPVVYDLGSGLLRQSKNIILKNEPTVKQTIEKGIDLVCFSGDKLLGGPQAGIIAGKKIWIDKLRKEPMLRALRVCKTTLALLETACLYYMDENILQQKNIFFKTLNRSVKEIKTSADLLQKKLTDSKISSEIISSKGQCGGGTLPDAEIDSFSLVIKTKGTGKENSAYAEKMYAGLLHHKTPILALLLKGKICFDMLTLFNEEIPLLAHAITDVHQSITKQK